MAILGTGTEIIECLRIQKMVEAHGEQFLERVYTSGEIEHCLATVNSTQNLAKRWAAKEATMKAMRCRHQGVRWTDIEVIVATGESPMIVLGGAAVRWAQQVGIETLHVSMGACRTHATAYILATDEME
ncbi:Holo-[acyl-carrier-protein] synthase [Rubripirellula obstinata]|uniref:Holo-[acyl-carrier-protein] synthase n=1 Tax=Rubripirellula obstinata TaxID=406547 RepID=A0A5B1CKM8_9BACT|nr:holo-ACP synthase [Rubripirellula obstinata]KAA1260090.1 Holo-[acyl-carrier-protein] synthase [Rubripirellula obstinata]